MFTLQRKFIGVLCLLPISTVLSGDMKSLSDIELATMTAQYGVLETQTKSRYESVQLENLFLTNNLLKERSLYFNNVNDALRTNNETLEHQIEMSLISLSTQVASTVALSALFPLFGLPIGIGMSSVPDAFEIEVTDVSIEMNMSIKIRE